MGELSGFSSDVVAFLRSRGILVVDHSKQGGAIWVPQNEFRRRLRAYVRLEFGARFKLASPGRGPVNPRGLWWKPRLLAA
jgi:hypothetical protein